VQVAADIGFPLMIKATAGGGGRGMRLVQEEKDFLRLLRAAQSEAEAAFGNGACYIERYVQNPRHIEVQVRAPCAPSAHHLLLHIHRLCLLFAVFALCCCCCLR
jgi:acetyl-CoA carboxylase, biotin carboxylase subunit